MADGADRAAMDAVTLLKEGHRTVSKLFRRFEQLGDDAKKTKREVVDQIIKELSIHAAIEEQLFYPAVKEIDDDIREHVLESLEEHHVVKWTLSELEDLDPSDERFDAKVTVLIESVRHHVEEEETEFFPKVREAWGRKVLADLGDAMAEAKQSAPTRPHPRSPDEPPANLVVGQVAALFDRALTAGREAVERRMAGSRR